MPSVSTGARARLVAVGAALLAAGVAAGYWLARAPGSHGPSVGESEAESETATATASGSTPTQERPREDGAPHVDEGHGAAVTARAGGADVPPACSTVVAQLGAARAEASARLRERDECRHDYQEEHGTPIPPPAGLPLRFAAEALQPAMTAALAAAHAPGSVVQGVDCTEYPCIVFGRLAGDEELLQRAEHARPLAPYRDDVRTVLFWMASAEGDEHDEAHDETGLFAVSYYTADDQQRLGDALDRRIRARTMELWSAIRPGTTSPSPPEGP